MTTDAKSSQSLVKRTSKTFGESVLRAMLVASEDGDGEPRKMTQHELASLSKVGRSTIAKYSAINDDENLANPDLITICRLANALNVSPAFLLMTPEDWSHLAQAALYLSEAMGDEKFLKMSSEIAESSVINAKATSLLGLQVAKKFKLYEQITSEPEMKNIYMDQITQRHRHTRRGILAMSALPPMGKLKKSHIVPLLSLCAIMGAHLKSDQ